MSQKLYFDYNATAPIRPEAAEAVRLALQIGGNPSSIHAAGRAARAVIETSREAVAALVGARPAEVVFTSGGSEANTLAIRSAVAAGARGLIIGATEHSSVQEAATASSPTHEWPVDRHGVADLNWLAARLKAWKASDCRPFVALMLANNETGVIQPVADVAEMVHAVGGWLHVDAVQAAGKMAIDVKALGADTLSLSAHKLGGPAGAGALIVQPRIELTRQAFGGGQERGRRGGTENLIGIAGFGAAAAMGLCADQTAWRDAAVARLKGEADVDIMGEAAPRLSTTLCFAKAFYPSELQVMTLDLAGIMVSAGSACSSGKLKASPVITAMGRPDLATCSIRVSGGWATTEADWVRFADTWLDARIRHAGRTRKLVEA